MAAGYVGFSHHAWIFFSIFDIYRRLEVSVLIECTTSFPLCLRGL